jgi:hypothetical protein
MQGQGWAGAEVTGEPIDLSGLGAVADKLKPAEPAAPMQVEVGPEFANTLAQYGQQDVRPAEPQVAEAKIVPEFSKLAAPEAEPGLTPRQVMVPPVAPMDWGGFPTDRLTTAMAQEHRVTGEATLTVDVNAPPGSKVGGNIDDGVFKRLNIKSGRQMPRAADQERGDNWND